MPRPPKNDDTPAVLRIDGKVLVGGYTFDVNNIVVRNRINDHAHGEQTVDLTVVLTRPIPKQETPR
jgi:hypothetical protein